MQNKDLIIIALIIVVVYLAYQNQANEQSPHIVESPLTQQLRSELNHYQTLYQQRIEKEVDDSAKVIELEKLKTDLEKKLTLTQQDLATSQSNAEELETLLEEKAKTSQEQLRKINVLFDDQANNYQTIDFQGLYTLLSSLAERETKLGNSPPVENETKPLSHKDLRKLKKKK